MGYENNFSNPVENISKPDIADAITPEILSLSPDARNAAKERLMKEYPEELEVLEAFWGLAAFIALQKRIEEEGREKFRAMGEQDRKEFFMNLTEYRFLITHFIVGNSNELSTLKKFWSFGANVSKTTNAPEIFERLKRSTLAQVAGFKILEAIGKKPKLATPEEDAFRAVDIRMTNGETIQIAGTVRGRKLKEIKKVGLPALQTVSNTDQFFSTNSTDADVVIDISKLGHNSKGYDMTIPYADINSITGEPSKDLVTFFSQKLTSREVAS